MSTTTEDRDLEWLNSHVAACPKIYESQAREVTRLIYEAGNRGQLPFTLGLFGTWGRGKTTLLATIARGLSTHVEAYKVVYFNSWKYSGLQEVVPSLVYKILKYGHLKDKQFGQIAGELLRTLGTAYGGAILTWLKNRLGVDVAALAQAARDASQVTAAVPERVLEHYCTQVDQIQALLADALGTAGDDSPITVVLVDELDRCDPDEAFRTINHIRAFFAMHGTPIVFVLCVNPEPIGLSIKHKYGLDSPSSDYEARAILEKFVDGYVDLRDGVSLEPFVRLLWERAPGSPTVQILDDTLEVTSRDSVKSATAFNSVHLNISLYANLRVLQKAYERMRSGPYVSQEGAKALTWTAWHLELAGQIDAQFRRDILTASGALQWIAQSTYCGWQGLDGSQEYDGWMACRVRSADGRVKLESGESAFGVYRSLFWRAARHQASLLGRESSNPEQLAISRTIETHLCDYRRMTFLANACLLATFGEESVKDFSEKTGSVAELLGNAASQYKNPWGEPWQHLGWVLSNY